MKITSFCFHPKGDEYEDDYDDGGEEDFRDDEFDDDDDWEFLDGLDDADDSGEYDDDEGNRTYFPRVVLRVCAKHRLRLFGRR